MNELPPGEHWFDRLATGMTRRTALKTGLAAAATIALPLVRSSSASADISTDPCFTGCRAFEHKQFGVARQACIDNNNSLGRQVRFGFSLLTGAVFGHLAAGSTALQTYQANRAYHACLDTAITNAKVAAFDCYGPFCLGFDPKQPGGPCDTCSENCCVCPGIPLGYICCFYACDDPDHNCCGS